MEVVLNLISVVSFIGMLIFASMLDSPNMRTPLIGALVCGFIFFLSAALNGYVGDFEE